MEKQLQELMQQINDTGRSVSWSKTNFLYEERNRGGIYPVIEYWVSIFKPQSSRLEITFTTRNIQKIIKQVEDWMKERGMIATEDEIASASGDPF